MSDPAVPVEDAERREGEERRDGEGQDVVGDSGDGAIEPPSNSDEADKHDHVAQPVPDQPLDGERRDGPDRSIQAEQQRGDDTGHAEVSRVDHSR